MRTPCRHTAGANNFEARGSSGPSLMFETTMEMKVSLKSLLKPFRVVNELAFV